MTLINYKLGTIEKRISHLPSWLSGQKIETIDFPETQCLIAIHQVLKFSLSFVQESMIKNWGKKGTLKKPLFLQGLAQICKYDLAYAPL